MTLNETNTGSSKAALPQANPAMAVAELMGILLDEGMLSWDEAWHLTVIKSDENAIIARHTQALCDVG